MKREKSSLFRIILIISGLCAFIVLLSWKSLTRDTRRFDRFFDPVENALLYIDADSGSTDAETDAGNTITTIKALSETNPAIISFFSFVADRYATRYMLNVSLSVDLYQYHLDNSSFLEPLAKGVKAVFTEERLLNNDLKGLMFTAAFSDLENTDVSEELRTLKPGYRLAVKFNPELFPGFFYITSPGKGPMCLIRGEVK